MFHILFTLYLLASGARSVTFLPPHQWMLSLVLLSMSQILHHRQLLFLLRNDLADRLLVIEDHLPVVLMIKDCLPIILNIQDRLPVILIVEDRLPDILNIKDRLPVILNINDRLPVILNIRDRLPVILIIEDRLPVILEDHLHATLDRLLLAMLRHPPIFQDKYDSGVFNFLLFTSEFLVKSSHCI